MVLSGPGPPIPGKHLRATQVGVYSCVSLYQESRNCEGSPACNWPEQSLSYLMGGIMKLTHTTSRDTEPTPIAMSSTEAKDFTGSHNTTVESIFSTSFNSAVKMT